MKSCFRHLLTASADGKLLLWDGLTKNKLHMVNLNGPWVVTCAISPSGRVAAAGGFDNNCALYRYLLNLKKGAKDRCYQKKLWVMRK